MRSRYITCPGCDRVRPASSPHESHLCADCDSHDLTLRAFESALGYGPQDRYGHD